MTLIKKYSDFRHINESEEFEVSDVPNFQNSTTAVLNLGNKNDATILLKINQAQFNEGGSIRYSDVDGIEKASDEISPFLKAPGEDYPISDVPNDLIISYKGTSYRVISKS